jgi:hypothetical protein
MADENINATPTLTNGQITWTMCDANGKCSAPGSYPAVDLGHHFFPSTTHFNISITNDQTGMGIVFAPAPPPQTNDGPLWVQAGSKPTAATVDPHIDNVNGAGTTTLKFTDHNKGSAVDLYYRLNFVDSKGQKVSPIDPEIKNGGSTIGFSTEAFVVAAVVLIALITVAYRTFLRGR